MYTHSATVFLAILSLISPTLSAHAPEWRRRSIYQIVTDRFSRSDNSLIAPCDTQARKYCGGSWKGITNRLDYIANMGFTAIWISPIVKQLEGSTGYGEAYHGYWTRDLYSLNPQFGTQQDLMELIDAAHARDIYVMLDVVLNHFASLGPDVNYAALRPFDNARYFHSECDIDWGNQTSIEACWMGDSTVRLPDINTEDPDVQTTLKQYLSDLVTSWKIDGIRLDASRNVAQPSWAAFCSAANVYCQGEVWVREPSIICPYQTVMDGLHNYPAKELATIAFASSGSLNDFISVVQAMQTQCKDVTLFGSFMENHDNPRLGSLTTDRGRLTNLAVINVLSDGIPIVYYGQEQAFTGSDDPNNREALWLSQFSTSGNLVPTFKALNIFRNYVVASGVPFISTLSVYKLINDNVMTARKGSLTLVLTNSGSNIVISSEADGFTPAEDLVDVLSCKHFQSDVTGKVDLILSGYPLVLYPRALLLTSGICSL
ncbi:unnamed protein product [Mycena citricolor]|uniref:alpha-amylase n=1 Tax=Mycena citricolor TaxID=2018698 RepID=A0AAD2GS86_9AGAR|nr:unnamed protein product [Mycena citricolor]